MALPQAVVMAYEAFSNAEIESSIAFAKTQEGESFQNLAQGLQDILAKRMIKEQEASQLHLKGELANFVQGIKSAIITELTALSDEMRAKVLENRLSIKWGKENGEPILNLKSPRIKIAKPVRRDSFGLGCKGNADASVKLGMCRVVANENQEEGKRGRKNHLVFAGTFPLPKGKFTIEGEKPKGGNLLSALRMMLEKKQEDGIEVLYCFPEILQKVTELRAAYYAARAAK